MLKIILTTLAVLLFLAAGGAVAFWLGPLMLTSGRPELILLAWLLPFCWLISGVLAYIAWADSSWPPPEPVVTPDVKPVTRIDIGALITTT